MCLDCNVYNGIYAGDVGVRMSKVGFFARRVPI